MGRHLITTERFDEGEEPVRECCSIRQQTIPNEWHTFYAQGLVESALSDREKGPVTCEDPDNTCPKCVKELPMTIFQEIRRNMYNRHGNRHPHTPAIFDTYWM